MKGKKSEVVNWIRDYLESQNIDTSSWEEYQVYYNRYAARIRKYHPENYEQFLNLCTFTKQRKKRSGGEDLGDWERELGGWHKKGSGPKTPKSRPSTYKLTFNEERYWRDQKKEWDDWKARMQRYREDKIRNQTEISEKAREKDYMPYMFKFALRCLSGVIPEECFPEALNEYKEEFQNLLVERRS